MTLLDKGKEATKKYVETTIAADQKDGQGQVEAEVSIGLAEKESWGEWAVRIAGKLTSRKNAKPDASVDVSGRIEW